MSRESKWSVLGNALLAVALGWGGFQFMGLMTTQDDNSPAVTDYCQLTTKGCSQGGVSVTLDSDVIHPLQSTRIRVSWPRTPPRNRQTATFSRRAVR